MEKKWFVALLMVVVMMCACWTGAVAEDERDYQYALLDDGTVEITGYNGKAEKLTIPNMLNGKKVTSIDNRAFYLCNSLISIIIPDSVAKISVNPFAYCSTLKSIFVSSEHPYFFAIDGVLFRKADSCLISYPKGREYTTYKDTPHNCAQPRHIIPADPNFEKKRNSSALFAREINLVTQPSFDCEQGINSQVQTAYSNADAIFPVLGIVFCKNERFFLLRKTHVPLWNAPRISHVRLP